MASSMSDEALLGGGSEERARGASLVEICAPTFLFLTTFRRNAATSDLSLEDLRARIKQQLETARRALREEQRWRKHEETIFYLLVATADQAILSSEWKQTTGFRMNLLETEYFGTATGGQRFFEIMEQNQTRSTPEAVEIAELMFLSMGIGFQGAMLGDQTRLEKQRLALYDKAQLPAAMGDRLAPDSYGRNEQRSLVKLPQLGLARVILVSVVVLIVLGLMGKVIDDLHAKEVRDQIETVIEDHLPSKAGQG